MSGIFDQLSDRIGQVSQLFKKAGKINETHLADAVKELRKALLEADVHYKVAKDFSNIIKEKLLGAEILKSVQPQELFLKKLIIFLATGIFLFCLLRKGSSSH